MATPDEQALKHWSSCERLRADVGEVDRGAALAAMLFCVWATAARADSPPEQANGARGSRVAAPASRVDDHRAQQERKRAELRTYHRSFGITTWISLGATTAIGTIRYANVIGFGQPLCREGGSPIFGREWGCGDGLRYQHAISATFTTLSYITTRTLAALMPEPYEPRSTRLSIHRALSWVHLAGMVAMPILGIATSRTSDVDRRHDLATAHLIVGYSTFAAVTAAGAVMTF